MAFNLKEFFLTALLPTLETIGESKLEDLLNQLQATDPTNFETDLKAAYNLFVRIDVFAKQSTSKIDDAVIELVLKAISTVADQHGISLP